ncbi:MAG: hypothetical protein A3I44_01095 [Candidatus Sungbacteria bacterium RIFCSPLOWO2_02_FULL_51_17]|uniref:DUF3137 domain-containing protein n=1 Tax=Candidatus Sungbacteria bacterium RIFCSPHIGHO2_02_FULL_51_29 TaxID=1802273 RepID=A0A1G2KWV2_9BACT|nr:MAG: hypothetical protein A2676_03080 [Candidatus Sungbacteria bacterium RIFCSPHIGHO2_01_FULL_51_22]OHA03925.1 MAG: hypothetical protein A3C16_03880 [Candidatus Sungbacteria bacterium RIFCSPHIGHO2_02_FULL_51_29]OHA12331.1 MAG: hypothetical protein A3I44_01095 [Candidatus Sungbacteria bacterium RIFCSPLOWO2_02_FULL_51_17]
MSEANKLAAEINEQLATLHDGAVSEDPFVWSDTEKDRRSRRETFAEVTKKLTSFVYISRAGTAVKILLGGTVAPLVLLAVLYLAEMPTDENMRVWVWGCLVAIGVISIIIAAVITHNPSIDSALCLAAYTVPRDWSFSSANTDYAWATYQNRFAYFNQGDEDQEIQCRMWGYMDRERKRPFQLFQFYFETVYYTTEVIRDAKGNMIGTRQVKHEDPHYRYGMFAAMPESKVHFRIAENSGTDFDTTIALEYGALNKAMNIGCNAKDELAVRQFLSPAVQEVIMKLSEDCAGLHMDFYPGLVLVVTENNFLDAVKEITLDKNARRFAETIKPAGDLIERFGGALVEGLDKIRKYNDNY